MKTSPIPRTKLSSLLAHLATQPPNAAEHWQDWHITPITGGWNNLLYRATNEQHDWAIKFTIRDTRQRARREFIALQALQQASITHTPRPILLDEDSYAQPVIVQSWLAGEVASTPVTDDDWTGLLTHYARIHSITPNNTPFELLPAVMTAHTARQVINNVHQEITRIPAEAHHPQLAALVQQLEKGQHPNWPPAPVTLCRTDPNIRNFIYSHSEWSSVDWENSGWGDPAWEIADLLAHPAYMDVSPHKQPDIIATYCRLVDDPGAAERIHTYYKAILVWWVARLARYMYDTAHNLNQRLVQQPEARQLQQQTKLKHYIQRAKRALS